MTTSTRPNLESFAAWIRETDPHAAHRLELLRRVQECLSRRGAVSPEVRRSLADRVERWRYQLLNERAGRLSTTDEALGAALDLAANDLAGRARRPPRSARRATTDRQPDSRAIADAMACLDPAVPLEDVIRRASELTMQHFGPLPTPVAPASARPMLLYAPLYLSSHCINHCAYCEFRYQPGYISATSEQHRNSRRKDYYPNIAVMIQIIIKTEKSLRKHLKHFA